MIRLCLLLICLFVPSLAGAQSVQVEAASEACKVQILRLNSASFSPEMMEEIYDACDDFPLSDSLAAQVVAAIVGPDVITSMNAYSFVTGVPHGFEDNDNVFSAVPYLHELMGAMNGVVFYGALSLVAIASLFKAFRIMIGDQRFTLGDLMGMNIPSKVGRLLLTMPTLGWITPFQFIGLFMMLVAFVVVKKLVVALFLFGFGSDVALGVAESNKEGLTHELGDNILMYHCDIKRRENIMSIIQTRYGTRDVSVLGQDRLYQCLTSPASSVMTFSPKEDSDVFTRKRGVPPVIAHTESCIENNKVHWENELGGGDVESCGMLTLNVPSNKASDAAMSKLESLTTSTSIREKMRDVAIQLYTYQCRKVAKAQDYTSDIISSCLALEVVGGGYRYITSPDPVTGQEKLSAYTQPMTTESRRDAIRSVRSSIEDIRSVLIDNNAAIQDLIQSMAAPKNDSDIQETGLQKSMSEAPMLITEEDAEAMVMRIRRGAWMGSSLFFDKISDDLAESTLVGALSKIYAADLPDDDGVIESSARDLTDSLDLLGLTKGVSISKIDATARKFLPMVSLYEFQRECWIDVSSCQSVPINPFYYIIKDGIKILERSLIGVSMSAAAEEMVRNIPGLSGRDYRQGGYGKIQLFSVVGDYFWIYAIYGLLLAVVIPAFPFFKLLAMLFAWSVDLIMTLFTANAKIALSTINGDEDGKVFNRDVRDAFRRVVGLALYFSFIIVGLLVFFLMFTALFAFNVIVLGVLESLLNAYSPFTALDMGVMRVIIDGIMVALLVYEVRSCMPYMETIPQDMAKHFSIEVTRNDEIVHMMWSQAVGWMPTFADNVRAIGHQLGR